MNLQERALESRTGSGRVFVLDALRGIAAFTVLIHHFHYAFRGPLTSHWYLRPLISGHESVMLFFALSGYVLSVPVWRGKQLPYGLYVVRRLCRIYLPFAAAVLLSAAVGEHFLFARLPLLHEWFYLTWQQSITWRVIASGLLMSTKPILNTAFWSLHFEMEISLIFPFLCLMIGRLRNGGAILMVLLLSVAAFFAGRNMMNKDPLLISDSLRYCVFFLMGALMAKNQRWLIEVWQRFGLMGKLFTTALSLGLYFHFLGLVRGQLAVRLGISDSSFLYRADFVVALGAAGIIFIATSSGRVQRFLDKPLFEYLGRVSYSMYLIHAVILFASIDLLYGKIPILAIGAIYLVVTMALSHLFLIGIEEPSLRLGKRLTSKRRAELAVTGG